MKNVMKYHLESEVAFCRDISSRGKFQNNSLLEKFLLQKESGEINPDPRALGFLGFSTRGFCGNNHVRTVL